MPILSVGVTAVKTEREGGEMFEMKSTEDLMRIAGAGGGFEIRGGMRPTEDLIRIAGAAAQGGGQIFIRGMGMRPVEDLMRIAAAGRGRVVFADKLPDD